ncbi:MAG: thiamine pyrophosphate-dependent dehydrogenase E1 component subunit alpha [Alkalispirochaetaceae bacterium]
MEGSSGKNKKKKPDLSKEKLREMYTQMLLTRAFEEKVAYFFSRGMVHGTTHLYVGEEATAIGAIANFEDDEWMTSTHRGHGHTIAKGLDVNRMMAELLGKESGYCKGKGGSMHISDITMGHLGANGIVGGGIPIATGAALTVKLRGEDKVVLCFFGDGAINEGTFHESLNMASAWKLPVVYICENNQYGMSMSTKRATNIDDLSVRAQAYGIPGKRIDGQDVFEVYDAVKEAKEHARTNGPYLIISETYRYLGHSKSDANAYRTKEEISEWKKKDPIPRMRSYLEENKIFTPGELDTMEADAKQAIEDAVEFANKSPDPNPEDLPKDVYAD